MKNKTVRGVGGYREDEKQKMNQNVTELEEEIE